MDVPWVVAFDDDVSGLVDRAAILGGKGAGLVEMTQSLGLPVPPGFVITTAVCRRFQASGWPDALDPLLDAALESLGRKAGARFGDPSAPLLVSVRSGAPVSMPGMMDTLLNVGMTPEVRDTLAAASGSAHFAADTWARFHKMYAEVVLGLSAEEITASAGEASNDVELLASADRIKALAEARGYALPADPREQLRRAVEAVFLSWQSERARVFRAHENISDDLGTAVTIQCMAFGNLDALSGTGVAFTRDPATGANHPFGDYLPRAQGEDVVAGTHEVRSLESMREHVPEAYEELVQVLGRLERHYRDMCDVEFTVSAGKLYILQTRVGRRTPAAAVRIAVAMAEDSEFPLTRAEAVSRVGPQILDQIAAQGSVAQGAVPIGRGLAASPGVGVGVLCTNADRAAELAAGGTPVILAREQTSPEDIHGMIGAAGLLTTRGGVVSHAAVVARSWSIPAVTSLADATVEPKGVRVGGMFIAEGEQVTVDGTSGAVYAGDTRVAGGDEIPEVQVLRRWASEIGVEPGSQAPAPAKSAAAEASLFEVVRAIQLKGICSLERAAAYLEATTEAVSAAVEQAKHLFRESPRGFMLTPEGRAWVAAELAAERGRVDNAKFDDCYQRFMPLNHRFKKLVTDWQTKGSQQEGREAFDALLVEMRDLHAGLLPIIDEAAQQAERLAAFTRRFDQSLELLAAGDVSMLASPLKESYHTLWFELHEELIELCGRDRAVEEA